MDESTEKQESPAPPERKAYRIKEFCEMVGIGYGAYRTMRKAGRAPKELRMSRRTIRITEEAIAEWRMNNETAISGQSTLC